MTEDNKRSNIQEELARAETARGSAELLFENAYLVDAVSRLYYGVFHTIKALLLSKGFEPKTHEGALNLFSLHFVKRGPFGVADAHLLSRLMKYRQEADYNPSYVFTKADYLSFKKDAVNLCTKIEQYLRKKGYR